jgi:hypothetical protein
MSMWNMKTARHSHGVFIGKILGKGKILRKNIK